MQGLDLLDDLGVLAQGSDGGRRVLPEYVLQLAELWDFEPSLFFFSFSVGSCLRELRATSETPGAASGSSDQVRCNHPSSTVSLHESAVAPDEGTRSRRKTTDASFCVRLATCKLRTERFGRPRENIFEDIMKL